MTIPPYSAPSITNSLFHGIRFNSRGPLHWQEPSALIFEAINARFGFQKHAVQAAQATTLSLAQGYSLNDRHPIESGQRPFYLGHAEGTKLLAFRGPNLARKNDRDFESRPIPECDIRAAFLPKEGSLTIVGIAPVILRDGLIVSAAFMATKIRSGLSASQVTEVRPNMAHTTRFTVVIPDREMSSFFGIVNEVSASNATYQKPQFAYDDEGHMRISWTIEDDGRRIMNGPPSLDTPLSALFEKVTAYIEKKQDEESNQEASRGTI